MRVSPTKISLPLIAAALLLSTAPAYAQMRALNDAVVAHPDPESLFTSPDPKLHRNKQAALKIVKELLEANHWDRAPLYLTDRYIQHNPMAGSGLKAVMDFFMNVAKRTPTPIPEKMKTPVVAVQAEGDFVTVSFVREAPYPNDPSKTYTTTWFDMWRFVDGKADEHWDPATLPAAPPPAAAPTAAPAAPSQPVPPPAG
ncbi:MULTISPECIES: nuclear transport factor 2 family protein [unclassified Sphingobium]|uniref:nuclear transport factor 2 family protein n=1 Tax=unclassified Sphingobium TaxID=2611147 RepID=UPI0022242AE7|nr:MULTISPECIES: nuclear transport factor 2 family protein [unclassified Sphingobium]MCW2411040.1 putative SnoaL-like aldol condensation-catalyzing enzyme [Sphingobium sp. B8D3D]MCW2416668.1 putative SnoaL-like aldol condensation-catalyzing enzyme [Sphingobium sp. B8D3A]